MYSIKNFTLILFFLPTISFAQKILFLGDSLTEGLGVEKSLTYPYQLDILLKKNYPNITIVVDGISGSTSASGPARLKNDLKQNPELLVLALGANDGLRGSSTSAMQANLQKTIDLANQAGIKVLLLGMILPDNYGKSYTADFKKAYHDLYNKNKKNNQIYFYPFLLDGVALKPELNRPDGLHPNDKGYKIIAGNLYRFFISEKILDN